MKPSPKGLSSYLKFFAAFFFITIIVFADYYAFFSRSNRLELYDDLGGRLNSIRASTVRFGHKFDMLLAARRFDATTLTLVKRDLERLDRDIGAVVGNPGYITIVNDNIMLSEGLVSIAEGWQAIKNVIANLKAASTEEEVMLVHNAVDVNAVLINEISERLLGVIYNSRTKVLDSIRSQVLYSLTGFLIVIIAAFMVFYMRYLAPLQAASSTADRISSGALTEKFGLRGGNHIRKLADRLNAMLKVFTEENSLWDKKYRKIAEELNNTRGQIEALGILNVFAGSSLSWAEMFSSSVKEAVGRGGVDGAGIYIEEGGVFVLKASAGFDEPLIDYPGAIPPRGAPGDETDVRIFNDLDEYPDTRYAALLKSAGFSSLVSVPVSYDNRTIGYFYACFREEDKAIAHAVPFIEAITSNLRGFAGYVDLFHMERNEKRFLERVVNQVPFGVAVFDASGTCRMVNNVLKRFLGAGSDVDLVGDFQIFEDDVLLAQGMIPTIRKTYEGYGTEFIINYNPALLKKYKFKSAVKRFKISSMPFYDQGGEISSIILLYEDLSDSAESGERAEDAV